MGVKQTLDHDLESEIGSIQRSAPRYSLWVKMKLLLAVVTRGKFCHTTFPSIFMCLQFILLIAMLSSSLKCSINIMRKL